jgi:hypothetical protein
MSEEQILREVLKIKSQNEEILSRLDAIEKKLGLKDERRGATTADDVDTVVKPSEVAEEQNEGEKEEDDNSTYERLSCPRCSSINIAHVEDRKDIISYTSGLPFYGKKWVCKDCNHEWK